MMYKAEVAVCFEILTKHSMQSEHLVEFWMFNLVVHKETSRLLKVKVTFFKNGMCCFLCTWMKNV